MPTAAAFATKPFGATQSHAYSSTVLPPRTPFTCNQCRDETSRFAHRAYGFFSAISHGGADVCRFRYLAHELCRSQSLHFLNLDCDATIRATKISPSLRREAARHRAQRYGAGVSTPPGTLSMSVNMRRLIAHHIIFSARPRALLLADASGGRYGRSEVLREIFIAGDFVTVSEVKAFPSPRRNYRNSPTQSAAAPAVSIAVVGTSSRHLASPVSKGSPSRMLHDADRDIIVAACDY